MSDGASLDRGEYDLVGIGFGPSNLALAIALLEREQHGGEPLAATFLERQERFGWHRDMLLPGATLQVNHLKDLATLRDPRSAFGFLSYLHERGRLVDFINHKTHYPTRLEFHDYLEWAAGALEDWCEYGTDVVAVRPVTGLDGTVEALDVDVLRGGELSSIRTRDLVLGLGLEPRLPDGVAPSARVWHSDRHLGALAALPGRLHRRFAVVGAGQSAAEVADHLHRSHPDSDVHAVFASFGYVPADDSPYANRIFDPAAIDEFHVAPRGVQEKLLAYHATTNYSVVDLDLIEELYRREYAESVAGERRLRIENTSALEVVADREDGVVVRIRDNVTGTVVETTVDAVVFATGYRPAALTSLLGQVAEHLVHDELGRPVVERDYSVRTRDGFTPRIHLQGGTEHSHGLTSSLLSAVAVRAGEIAESVAGRSGVDRRAGSAPVAESAR